MELHQQGRCNAKALKFKFECLIKHMADAHIPNTRLCAKSQINSNLLLMEGNGNNIENDSKVQAKFKSFCGIEHKQTTQNKVQCQIAA